MMVARDRAHLSYICIDDVALFYADLCMDADRPVRN